MAKKFHCENNGKEGQRDLLAFVELLQHLRYGRFSYSL